jgi:hypothetical protein
MKDSRVDIASPAYKGVKGLLWVQTERIHRRLSRRGPRDALNTVRHVQSLQLVAKTAAVVLARKLGVR